MARNLGIKGDVALEYIKKFPRVATHTLARKMYKENPSIYKGQEHARSVIRYHRDASGNKNREYRSHSRDQTVQSSNNKYNLPETDALEYPIFKLPQAQNKIIILADVHVPYHDVDAITGVMDWAKEHGVNTFLLSEWLDCHHLSKFVRDPRKKRFKEERVQLWRILDVFQNEFPSANFYYREGNHEQRYGDYMKSHAPEIYDTSEFAFDILMKFGERGIHYISDKLRIRMGELFSLHGHEFQRSMTGPVNPARGLFMKTKQSAICEHYHQTSEHSEPTLDGSVITCWSVGCLCDLHPEYAPLNKWNHGFARVKVNPDDTFQVTNLRIKNGKVL